MAAIEIKGLDRLARKIEILPAIKAGIKAAALHIKGKIAEYPQVRRGPQPFKSDKSRRFFFWALREGLIDVPYRRGTSPKSETLGRKWTIASERGGLAAKVGNNVSYGPLVQDRERQSFYHKTTGWKTTQDVVEQEGDNVRELLEAEIGRLFNE